MASPKDWTPEQEEHKYAGYAAGKVARGLEPRDRDGWRAAVDFWQQQKERGDAFRDAGWQELGFSRADGWDTEVRYDSPLGLRRFDIAHAEDGIAYEFKAGGLNREHGMQQLRKDSAAIQQDGWNVTWVCHDQSKIDPRVRSRMQALAQEHPGRFNIVDLADRSSVDRLAARDPRTAEALRLANLSFAKTATAATSANRSEDPGQEAVRTGLHRAQLDQTRIRTGRNPTAAERNAVPAATRSINRPGRGT